ncbi:MAG: aminopeptidase, partial [Paracoccus marcusii]
MPRPWRGALTWGIVLSGVALAVATLAVMGPFGRGMQGATLRVVLLADLAFLIVLIGFIVARMARLISARRSTAPASRLHARLVAIFGGLALVPTVLVALFAGFLVNIGLEGWFSDPVLNTVMNRREHQLAALVFHELAHQVAYAKGDTEFNE